MHSFLTNVNLLLFRPRRLSVSIFTSSAFALTFASSSSEMAAAEMSDEELLEVLEMEPMERRVWPHRRSLLPLPLTPTSTTPSRSPEIESIYSRAEAEADTER